METLTRMNFRPIELSDITPELLKEIGKMHLEYFQKSRDASLTVPQVFDVIQAVVGTTKVGVKFWLLLDEEKLSGFAITEFFPGARGPEMHIAQAYIAPGYRGMEVQKLTVETFEKLARDMGCVFLTSCTRREPFAAYERWMGRAGFKKRWIVMEKNLQEGQ